MTGLADEAFRVALPELERVPLTTRPSAGLTGVSFDPRPEERLARLAGDEHSSSEDSVTAALSVFDFLADP